MDAFIQTPFILGKIEVKSLKIDNSISESKGLKKMYNFDYATTNDVSFQQSHHHHLGHHSSQHNDFNSSFCSLSQMQEANSEIKREQREELLIITQSNDEATCVIQHRNIESCEASAQKLKLPLPFFTRVLFFICALFVAIASVIRK